ncbi:MAG: hypothetical protein ABI648_02090 [Betaproteobacteria bacterium]
MPVWLNEAGVQAVVRWQASQEAVVEMWPDGLPLAVVPLWQVPQAPGTTPVWSMTAPVKVVVPLWQPSQDRVVTT